MPARAQTPVLGELSGGELAGQAECGDPGGQWRAVAQARKGDVCLTHSHFLALQRLRSLANLFCRRAAQDGLEQEKKVGTWSPTGGFFFSL